MGALRLIAQTESRDKADARCGRNANRRRCSSCPVLVVRTRFPSPVDQRAAEHVPRGRLRVRRYRRLAGRRQRLRGGWFVYTDGQKAPDPTKAIPTCSFNVPDPPRGSRRGDGHEPALGRASSTATSGWTVASSFTQRLLRGHGAVQHAGDAGPRRAEPNQQFRIDLVDPSAPIDSLAKGDVLVNVFHLAGRVRPASSRPR